MKIFFQIISFILILPSGCSSYKTTEDMNEILSKDKLIIQEISNTLLNQDSIKWISISGLYDSTKCQGVNSWSSCNSGKTWETWSDSLNKTIYLNSLGEVLKEEKIRHNDYIKYVNALKKVNLDFIGKGYTCKDCIELESGLAGIFYSKNGNSILKQNFEYVVVKQIDNHWYLYERDWN